jgi:hypothetical protein
LHRAAGTEYSFKNRKIKQRCFRSSVFQIIKQYSTDLKINKYTISVNLQNMLVHLLEYRPESIVPQKERNGRNVFKTGGKTQHEGS